MQTLKLSPAPAASAGTGRNALGQVGANGSKTPTLAQANIATAQTETRKGPDRSYFVYPGDPLDNTLNW